MSAAPVFEDDYPTGPIDMTDPDVPSWMDQPRDRLGQFAKKEEPTVSKLFSGAVSVSAPAEGVNFTACRVVKVGGRTRVLYADDPAFYNTPTPAPRKPVRGRR
jgi:hypothetical protein